MKYLVATKHTQGAFRRDFCFCDEGEPVMFPIDITYPYMVGMDNRKGTTTVMVKDGFVKENLVQQTFNVLKDERFNNLKQWHGLSDIQLAELCSDAAEKMVESIALIADPLQIQTVLSVSGNNVYPVRALPDFSGDSITILDALCNVNKMITGSGYATNPNTPEPIAALMEEVLDEISRVLPPNPYQ